MTLRLGVYRWFFVIAISVATALLFAETTPAQQAEQIKADKPAVVVTLGDSITKGARPGVTKEQTFAALLEEMLKENDVSAEVVNVGIGGERTDQALLRLERDVLSKKPALVTIMYGTNDSYVDVGKQQSRISAEAYRANLVQLVKQLREAGVTPVLMTEPRWGRAARKNGVGEHPNMRLSQYVAKCREVAKELDVPLVDHFRAWTAADEKGTDVGSWTTDQCHPNPEGHRKLAKDILPVILPLLTAE